MILKTPETATPPPHLFKIRVYYEDTDAGGIVYYANYLKFAERARSEMLRDAGIDQQNLRDEQGLMFVVRRCAVDYHLPARLDDLLDIGTMPERLGGASLDLMQEVRLDGRLLVALQVRLALLNQAMRPSRLPADLIAAIKQQYQAGN